MRIYFMGIGGTAMGNAALLARAGGHQVTGADENVYPPMSDVLRESGIEYWEGYDADRLAEQAPDLVVVGNAMSRGHPEVEWLLEKRALRFTSLPALLSETVLTGRKNVVIAGTHGKTTTTALTAFLMRENGRDPGFLIGGVPLDPPMGQHFGRPGDPFVIEGDEYDSAFFDKRSKFIHYAPHIAVLNNLEFDHADIFRDLPDVQRTFRHLTRIVPRNGYVLVNGDDANLAWTEEITWTNVLRVGEAEHNDLRILDFVETPAGASFGLSWKGQPWGNVTWSMSGLFNARNGAMAALAAGLALNPADPSKLSLAGLARFRGVRRRQEVKLSRENLTVFEDFGHHPTAIAATLQSLRARYPKAELIAAFEPRSNSARTKVHQTGFIDALTLADRVYLGAVNRSNKLSAAERFDAGEVIAALQAKDTPAETGATNAALKAALVDHVATVETPGVVVFFTNGSFDGIIGEFVAAMES